MGRFLTRLKRLWPFLAGLALGYARETSRGFVRPVVVLAVLVGAVRYGPAVADRFLRWLADLPTPEPWLVAMVAAAGFLIFSVALMFLAILNAILYVGRSVTTTASQNGSSFSVAPWWQTPAQKFRMARRYPESDGDFIEDTEEQQAMQEIFDEEIRAKRLTPSDVEEILGRGDEFELSEFVKRRAVGAEAE